MKRPWWLIPVSIALAGLLCHCASTGDRPATNNTGGCAPKDFSAGLHQHPTVQLARHYVDVDENCMFIVPYYLDIMAIHSLRQRRHLEEVRNFIDWTFDHLNDTDRWGLSGTVFDYVICHDGTEISTLQYDSADGYAGQFLMLIEEYYRRSKDVDRVRRHKEELFAIARVIIELQDEEDGLSIAMVGYPVKYLMDNSEACGGLSAFLKLADELDWKNTGPIAEARDAMKNGILKHLYNSRERIFYWAIEDEKQQGSRWNKYYPDALAQIFPILYGVIDADSELARHLWKRFESRYGDVRHRDVEQRLLVHMTREKMARQD